MNQHQHNILITGGTGFIGKCLCQRLLTEGYSITILTRNINKVKNHFPERIIYVENLEHIPEDTHFEAIIGLAGETVAQRWTPEACRKIIDSRIEDIQKVHTLIMRLENKPKLYIRASAISWYGTNEWKEFDENSQPDPDAINSFAYKICAELERETETITALGIRTCKLRVGLVLESDGGPLHKMLLPFSCGLGGRMGSGKQWWSWIHRDDLVAFILHLITTPQAEGIYNATAPTPVTNRDFSRALGHAMHRPAFLPMPAFILRLMLGKVADEIMLEGQKVLPHRTLESGFLFKYPTLQSALSEILKKNKIV